MNGKDTVPHKSEQSQDWRALYEKAEHARTVAETQVRHLSQVLTGLRDGFVMLDTDMRYRYVNAYTLQLMGRTEDEVLGNSFYELYPSLKGTSYDDSIQTALREKRPVEADLFYPTNNRYWRTLINPTETGLTIYYRDVTDLKATEGVQQRLAAIVQSSEDAIIGKTLEGIITNWNPAAERIFGYSAAEAIGKPKTILFPPDRLEEEVIILDRVRRGISTEHFETIRVRKDGALIHVSLTISPIKDSVGQIIGASTIARDITEYKRDEKHRNFLAQAGEILASSLEYETTLEQVARLMVPEIADWCVIHLLNPHGVLEQVSIVHVDPAKIQFAHEYSRQYPPDPNAPTGPYAVTRTGKSEWSPLISDEMIRASIRDENQYEMLSRVGMKSYICVPLIARGRSLGAITLITSESGNAYGAEDVAFIEEVARRAAIAVENARLFQAERERSEQLTRAISEVHHRVKNSLQCVSGLLEMQIPVSGDTLSVEAVQDSLYQIKTIALVHDLLARDKPISSVDIVPVLTNLGRLLASGMSGGQRQIRIEVDAESVEMSTRRATALALAVNELLTNAVKHQETRPGNTRDDTPAIQLVLRRHDDQIRITIQDSGPGFPPDFNLTQHASIGLQLVQTLVEMDLYGAVRFENAVEADNPDKVLGGRVEITFPASACLLD